MVVVINVGSIFFRGFILLDSWFSIVCGMYERCLIFFFGRNVNLKRMFGCLRVKFLKLVRVICLGIEK